MKKEFKSFNEFYLFYLSQHRDTTCRVLHIVGTLLIGIPLYLGIVTNPWYLLLIPIIGYGFAWTGHFVFEGNKPATFGHPGYSLLSDYVMLYHTLTFQIKSKMNESYKAYPE